MFYCFFLDTILQRQIWKCEYTQWKENQKIIKSIFSYLFNINLTLILYSFVLCDYIRQGFQTNHREQAAESVNAARGFTWKAFCYHWHTDFLSNFVRQTQLTFFFTVLSRLLGGSVLMSYLPAWMMISESQSSCSAKNKEQRDCEQSQTCWDTPESFKRPSQWGGRQWGKMDLVMNAYSTWMRV